jgi:hypothetical protein
MQKLFGILFWNVFALAFMTRPLWYPTGLRHGTLPAWTYLVSYLLAGAAGTLVILFGLRPLPPGPMTRDRVRARSSLRWVIALFPVGLALPSLLALAPDWALPVFNYPLRPFLTLAAAAVWFTLLIWHAHVYATARLDEDTMPLPALLRWATATCITLGVFAFYWWLVLSSADWNDGGVWFLTFAGLVLSPLGVIASLAFSRAFLRSTRNAI